MPSPTDALLTALHGEPCALITSPRTGRTYIEFDSGGFSRGYESPRACMETLAQGLASGRGTLPRDERASLLARFTAWLEADAASVPAVPPTSTQSSVQPEGSK